MSLIHLALDSPRKDFKFRESGRCRIGSNGAGLEVCTFHASGMRPAFRCLHAILGGAVSTIFLDFVPHVVLQSLETLAVSK